jgi:hypothetical protein
MSTAQFPFQRTASTTPKCYRCACCTNLHAIGQSFCNVGTDALTEQKEAEHRRRMQLDVIEDRAKPTPSGRSASGSRRLNHSILPPPSLLMVPTAVPNRGPSPPQTVQELRAAMRLEQQRHEDHDDFTRLAVVVHSARFSSLQDGHRVVLQVRFGVYEGATSATDVVGSQAVWQEQFALPIEDEGDTLWLSIIDPDAGAELLVGEVRAAFLHSPTGGSREAVLLRALRPMEGDPAESGGTVLLSWQVATAGSDGSVSVPLVNAPADEAIDCTVSDSQRDAPLALDQQALQHDVMIAFSVMKVTLYGKRNDLEDARDSCYITFRDSNACKDESVLLARRSDLVFVPNAGQFVAQVETSTRVVQALLCRHSDAGQISEDDEVIAATAMDIAKMPHHGSGALVLYAMSADFTEPTSEPLGEASVGWSIKPLSSRRNELDSSKTTCRTAKDAECETSLLGPDSSNAPHTPRADRGDAMDAGTTAALVVKVLRGVDLRDSQMKPLQTCRVQLSWGAEQGSTGYATCTAGEGPARMCNVRWTDDVVFTSREFEADRKRRQDAGESVADEIDEGVHVDVIDHDGTVVSSGVLPLASAAEGMTAVEMFSLSEDDEASSSLGHVLLRYARVALPTVEKCVGTEDCLDDAPVAKPSDQTEVASTAMPTVLAAVSSESPRDEAVEDALVDHRARSIQSSSPSAARRLSSPKAASPSGHGSERAAADLPQAASSPSAARRIEDSFTDVGDVSAGISAVEPTVMMNESFRHPDMELPLPQPPSPTATPVPDDDEAAHRQVSLQPARPPAFRVTSDGGISFFSLVTTAVAVSGRSNNTGGPFAAAAEPPAAVDRGRPPENGPLSETSLYNGIPSDWTEAKGGETQLGDALRREAESRNLMQEDLLIDIRDGKRRHSRLRPPLPYPAPWYPPGQGTIETHIPIHKRESQRKLVDEITVLQILAHKFGGERSSADAITVPMITRRPASRSTSLGAPSPALQ